MKKLLMSAALGLVGLFASSASAQVSVQCKITGTIKYEPMDLYYCDTDDFNNAGPVTPATCDLWKEIDLDKKRAATNTAVPMQYMKITVHDANEVLLGTGFTDANGAYTVTFTRPDTCTGKVVRFRQEFARVHETDPTKYRFRIVDETTCIANPGTPCTYKNWRTTAANVTLSGATTTRNVTRLITVDANGVPVMNPPELDHFYAVYYTANSAIKEMIKWSTKIDSAFQGSTLATQLPIVVDPDYTQISKTTSEAVFIDYTSFRAGATIRHELGHWAHQKALVNQKNTCLSYTYGGGVANEHFTDSCEFGYTATKEAIADFFAVRSITESDKNAWYCNAKVSLGTGSPCSDIVEGLVGDPEKDGLGNLYFVLGDTVANATAKCVKPGANCGGAAVSTVGFRMESQVARFFWDLIDTSAEANQDTVDLSMAGFVNVLQGFPCNSVFSNADGSCNEPNTALAADCTNSRRDKYNAMDFAQAVGASLGRAGAAADLPTDRTLNCVTGATD